MIVTIASKRPWTITASLAKDSCGVPTVSLQTEKPEELSRRARRSRLRPRLQRGAPRPQRSHRPARRARDACNTFHATCGDFMRQDASTGAANCDATLQAQLHDDATYATDAAIADCVDCIAPDSEGKGGTGGAAGSGGGVERALRELRRSNSPAAHPLLERCDAVCGSIPTFQQRFQVAERATRGLPSGRQELRATSAENTAGMGGEGAQRRSASRHRTSRRVLSSSTSVIATYWTEKPRAAVVTPEGRWFRGAVSSAEKASLSEDADLAFRCAECEAKNPTCCDLITNCADCVGLSLRDLSLRAPLGVSRVALRERTTAS